MTPLKQYLRNLALLSLAVSVAPDCGVLSPCNADGMTGVCWDARCAARVRVGSAGLPAAAGPGLLGQLGLIVESSKGVSGVLRCLVLGCACNLCVGG
jgi:hypothetical protein